MRHLLLARTNLERYFIIVLVVFFFVFLFNSCRLGKLKGRTLLCFAAVILAAAIAFFTLHTAEKDKAALCDYLGSLSEITVTDANDWYGGKKLTLSPEQTDAFLDALQGLSAESLREGEGVNTGDISVYLRTDQGEELLLKQSGNTVHFTFDEETDARFGSRHFQTDDGALLDAFFDLVD